MENKKKILVVDDEIVIRNVVCRLLNKMGLETQGAGSAEEAVKILEKESFDLLVSDLRLPGMDGLKLVRAFKQKFPNAEAIILTGYPSMETAQEAAVLGVFEYIAKPFERATIEAAVKRCLEKNLIHRQILQNKLVLAIEDEANYRRLIEAICKVREIPIITVPNSEEALKKVSLGGRFDLFLIDIGLPGMSGFEICHKFKINNVTKNIPVILMTATHRSRPDIENEAKAAGADLYLPKPADPFDLCDQMEKFLLDSSK